MASTYKAIRIARLKATADDETRTARTRINAARALLRLTRWSDRASRVAKRTAKTFMPSTDPDTRSRAMRLYEVMMNPEAENRAKSTEPEASAPDTAPAPTPPVAAPAPKSEAPASPVAWPRGLRENAPTGTVSAIPNSDRSVWLYRDANKNTIGTFTVVTQEVTFS